MHIELPELNVPTTLKLDREQGFSDEEYVEFYEANPDLRLERTGQGQIVIVPPVGGESDYRSADVTTQIAQWAKGSGKGKAFGSTVQFWLRDGSASSPDAAWVSNERLASLTKEQRRQFLHVIPEFIVEVMSPSDRLSAAKRKMKTWIATVLNWLG
jgi:Uma2 family endonuclease